MRIKYARKISRAVVAPTGCHRDETIRNLVAEIRATPAQAGNSEQVAAKSSMSRIAITHGHAG